MRRTTGKARTELTSLEERVRKLAADKSNLQLVVCMMNRISAVSGLDNMAEKLLQTIGDAIGGVHLGLYYRMDDKICYADAYGHRKTLDTVDDDLVKRVFETHETVEIEHAFSDTKMLTPEFSKAYTWVVPLLVGPDLVGVVKIESLHMAMRDLAQQLPTFFNHAALILKNEISGHSRLQRAFDDLEQEVSERKRAEEDLRQVNETLEERVAQRTQDLLNANDQLRDREKEIQILLSQSELSLQDAKRGEVALRRSNRELRAISNCNVVLMRAADENTLLHDICRIVCDEAGYRMTWVGYALDDEARTVRPVAWAGVEDGYLAKANITWADTDSGRGPTGTAIRSGKSACVQDFSTALQVARWREDAWQRGYRSCVALPLKNESAGTFGALTIYSTEIDAFTADEVRLLEELAGDLAFGVEVMRARIERQRAEEGLRESEVKYRSLIHELDVAVVVHTPDGRISMCNPVAQTLLGLTEDRLLGRAAVDPAWHFFREDETAMPTEEYPVHQVLATRQSVRNLVVGVGRSGHDPKVWAVVNANPVLNQESEISTVIVTFMDITERRQVQEKLNYLAAIVEYSDDAIIGKTLDERIVSWNRGAERIYGYTAGEMVGSPVSVLVPRGLKDELNLIMERLKRGERTEHLETTRLRKDHEIIHVALTISPIKDARGQIIGASTIARDITERKRAEEEIRQLNSELERRVLARTRELAESEERFRSIYESAPVSIWQEDWTEVIAAIDRLRQQGVTDFAAYFREHPEFVAGALKAIKILDVNPWTMGMFAAQDKAEMLASLATVFATPETLPGFTGELVALTQGLTVYLTEMTLNTVKGDLLHVLLAMSFPAPGTSSGDVLVSVIDITERKKIEHSLQKSEERMRLFFERQLVGTAIISPEGGWVQVNDKLCEMLGYSREELERLTWMDLTYPEDLAPDKTLFEQLLHNEIESYTLEKRFLRKDGSLVFTNLAVGCVRLPDRSVDYVVTLLEDITGRKLAGDQIRQLNQQLTFRAQSLELANRELESFSYSVSHDLRAPLRAIDGFSRIVIEDYAGSLDPEGLRCLERVRAASQRMGQLIDDLLQLSRHTRSELHLASVDLSALASALADELHRGEPERRVKFVIEPQIVVQADSGLMRSVLGNLLGNAWKFTSKKASAKIEFGRTTRQGAPAYFVRDNGVGFDMRHASRLFGAFQRLHGPDEFPGTGIGLATVQRIIHRHGGGVWAEGHVDQGATFTFSLSPAV